MDEQTMQVESIGLEQIYSDEDFNCRGRIAPIDVVDLARSIDDIGLQQPIVVQPYQLDSDPTIKYRIVSGHRRYTAHKVLGRKSIPARVKDGLDDLQARKWNLVENLKRQNLNMLQEANAIAHFKRAKWTLEMVASEIGMSRGWVQIRYFILDLPPEIQEEVAAGFLTQEQIKELSGLSVARQYEAVKRVKTAKLNTENPKRVKVRIKKIAPSAKKERHCGDIFVMQEHIQTVVGNNFGTRCLAWAAGEISDLEIYRDLKKLALDKGIFYEIPNNILTEATY